MARPDRLGLTPPLDLSARLDRLDVMADVWAPDRPERTRTGRLIEAAKDAADDAAVALLAAEAGSWAATLGRDVAHTLVVPVPPSPDRPNRLVPAAAEAIAEAWAARVVHLVERHVATPPLRHLAPEARPDAALAADYRIGGEVAGAHVVLVDDVILTGTTVAHVAEWLRAAGAVRVDAVVLARSRRA